MAVPRHRYEALLALSGRGADVWPADPVLDAMLRAARGDRLVPGEVLHCMSLAQSALKSAIVDAFLLAGATSADLRISLGVDPDVADLYRTYVFDTAVFRDVLDRYEYVHAIKRRADAATCDSDRHALEEAYKWAWWGLSHGLQYLKLRLNADAEVLSTAMVNRVINMAYLQTVDAFNGRSPAEARSCAGTFLAAVRTGAALVDTEKSGQDVEWEVVLSTPAESEAGTGPPLQLDTASILT